MTISGNAPTFRYNDEVKTTAVGINGTSLTTVSGRMVDLINPRPKDIDFDDICEQLAKENRYNGATPDACYSVAEHLSRGALAIYEGLLLEAKRHPPAGKLWREAMARASLAAAYFLEHDMPEAYLKDDTTPKKRALEAIATQEFGVLAGAVIAAFNLMTQRFDLAICGAASLPWPPPDDIAALVHRYDRIMLNTEWRDLMPVPHPWPIEPGEEPLADLTIKPWGWRRAADQLRADCRRWLPACREQEALSLSRILADVRGETAFAKS